MAEAEVEQSRLTDEQLGVVLREGNERILKKLNKAELTQLLHLAKQAKAKPGPVDPEQSKQRIAKIEETGGVPGGPQKKRAWYENIDDPTRRAEVREAIEGDQKRLRELAPIAGEALARIEERAKGLEKKGVPSVLTTGLSQTQEAFLQVGKFVTHGGSSLATAGLEFLRGVSLPGGGTAKGTPDEQIAVGGAPNLLSRSTLSSPIDAATSVVKYGLDPKVKEAQDRLQKERDFKHQALVGEILLTTKAVMSPGSPEQEIVKNAGKTIVRETLRNLLDFFVAPGDKSVQDPAGTAMAMLDATFPALGLKHAGKSGKLMEPSQVFMKAMQKETPQTVAEAARTVVLRTEFNEMMRVVGVPTETTKTVVNPKLLITGKTEVGTAAAGAEFRKLIDIEIPVMQQLERMAIRAAESPSPRVQAAVVRGMEKAERNLADAVSDIKSSAPKGDPIVKENVDRAKDHEARLAKYRERVNTDQARNLEAEIAEQSARKDPIVDELAAAAKRGDEGFISRELQGRLALAGIGGVTSSVLTTQARGEGEVWSPMAFLLGAAAGGFFGGKGVFSGRVNFERNAAQIMKGILPDRPIWIGGRRIVPWQTYLGTFTESGFMPAEVLAKKKAFNAKYHAIGQEMMDTGAFLRGLPQDQKTLAQKLVRGEVAPNAIARADVREAAADYRYLTDELSLGLLEQNMILPRKARTAKRQKVFDEASEALRKKIEGGVGVAPKSGNEVWTGAAGGPPYDATLYLHYEQRSNLLKVDRWRQRAGHDWKTITNPDWLKKKKNLSPRVKKELQEMIEDLADPGYTLMRRGLPLAQDIRNAQWSNYLASSEYSLADDIVEGLTKSSGKGGRNEVFYNGKLFRQMPDDKSYHTLAGKYVDANIANDYEIIAEVPKSLLRHVGDKATAFFKRAKVTWNPATLMRNIYGQLPLNAMGGVNEWDVHVWGPAIQDFWGKTPLYKEARATGELFGVGFFDTEVNIGALAKAAKDGKRSLHSVLVDWGMERAAWAEQVAVNTGRYPFKKMEQFHQATEEINKMILYRHARLRLKLPPSEAAAHAKRWAFDYTEVPRWVSLVRRSPFGAPFISFSYKAIPRYIEAALAVGNPKQFMSFWKYPAAFSAFNEFASRNMGFVPDDEKSLLATTKRIALNGIGLGIGAKTLGGDLAHQKFMQDYVGAQQILSPEPDDLDRQVFTDLTWLLPWGDVGEVGKGNLGKQLLKLDVPFARQLEPSNPILSTVVAALTGKDTFTGKDIVPERYKGAGVDEEGVRRSNNINAGWHWARFIARNYLPAMTPVPLPPPNVLKGEFTGGGEMIGRSAEKIRRAAKEQFSQDPSQPDLKTAIASEVFGIKKRPLDPRTGAQFKARALNKEIRAIRTEIAALGRVADFEGRRDAVDRLRELARQAAKLSAEAANTPETPKKLLQAIAKTAAEAQAKAKEFEKKNRKRKKK